MHTALARLFAAMLIVAGAVSSPAAAFDDTDVPFVTTPDNVTLAMLELAQAGPGDVVIDLGSGDGRIPILAARRFGAEGIGVEIVPDLVRRSQENARRAKVAERTRFLEQDLYATDLSPATVVTMYLLPAVNLQLRPRLLALKPGTRIVSHDWDMGDWLPDRSITVDAPDKPIGREKRSRLHLWLVPAAVEGRWCAPGSVLTLRQQFQVVEGTASEDVPGATSRRLQGRLEGDTLRFDDHRLVLRRTGTALQRIDVTPAMAYAPC